MAKNSKELKATEKSYKTDIAETEKLLESEKKKHRKSAKALAKAQGKIEPLANKAEANPTEKNIENLETAKKAVADALLEYKTVDDSIDVAVGDLQDKSDYLARFYSANGNSKDADKEKIRFDKYYAKHNEKMAKNSKKSDQVVSDVYKEIEEDMKRENTNAPVMMNQAPVAEPVYTGAVSEMAERQINIAPIDLDVSEIVAEAVDATMKSFSKIMEQRIGEFAATVPVAQAPAAPAAVSEASGDALVAIANEQAFVVNKLSELIDGMKEIMEAINALSAKSAELLEKQKAAGEVQNELTKTQRTTMREIQGIQVRQKLVITEQEALVAEQTTAFEHHKLVAEAQQALAEQQQISVEEINALVDNQKALNSTVKEAVDSNKALVVAAEKTAEAQKNLAEKQQDLVLLQKEIMAAHRQVARGQRSAESKRRTAPAKEAEVKAEEPVAEAAVEEAPATV